VQAEDAFIEGRRRPGVPQRDLPDPIEQVNPGALRAPPPEAFPTDHIPVPDRWRLIETLGVVQERWWDPYNQNTLKGDRPICLPTPEEQQRRREAGISRCATPSFLGLTGNDWFFVANLISDTVVEPREFPIPVGVQTTDRPDSIDVFGRNNSLVLAQTFIAGFALIKGNTAYRPPDVEYRVTFALQANYVDVPERRKKGAMELVWSLVLWIASFGVFLLYFRYGVSSHWTAGSLALVCLALGYYLAYQTYKHMYVRQWPIIASYLDRSKIEERLRELGGA
jgi:hypothetical protein